jgi:hypothetical protein
MEITNLVREVSGEDTTRIKSGVAGVLGLALLEQGVRCYPSLEDTTTGDTVRLFHAGSVFGNLVDLLIYPSNLGDKDLGAMLKKIKGQWDWSTPTGPAAQLDDSTPTSSAIPSLRGSGA